MLQKLVARRKHENDKDEDSPPNSPDSPLDMDVMDSVRAAAANWRNLKEYNKSDLQKVYMSYCLQSLAKLPKDVRTSMFNKGGLKCVGGVVYEAPGVTLMDGTCFQKLCRDYNLFTNGMTQGEGDVIFTAVKDPVRVPSGRPVSLHCHIVIPNHQIPVPGTPFQTITRPGTERLRVSAL